MSGMWVSDWGTGVGGSVGKGRDRSGTVCPERLGASRRKEGETISDSRICVGVRGALQEEDGGTGGRRYVQSVLDLTISAMVGMEDSSPF